MWRASLRGLTCIQQQRLPNARVVLRKAAALRDFQASAAGACCVQSPILLQVARCDFVFTLDQRGLRTCAVLYVDGPLKPSSKVEATVNALKENLKNQLDKKQDDAAPLPGLPPTIKPSLWKRVVDELKHYYHGFRLLFIDIRISWDLILRVLSGEVLTRREKRQLVRTASDTFRLVPFSVFIIVPFMEFTLPVFLKLFPNMLPSTFQTANEKEAKMKASLKVKLEMAKFLQQTLDEMALKGRGHQSRTAREFAEFFYKIRKSGEEATNDEILRFSKLFEDEITLDSLTRPQLTALCRVLEIAPIGTNNLLRFQLRMKLRSLAADDKVIQKEGVESLTIPELQAACRARGMRALGISEIRLKSQLMQWLDLSLNEKVPQSLLLLSRALYLPDDITASDQLKATIAALPESVVTQTRDAISQRQGKIDNAGRIEVLKLEEAKIKEERSERIAEGPLLEDKATLLSTTAGTEALTSKDLAALESALENIGVQKKRLIIEKEELGELKEEMAEYQEDVEELKDFLMHAAQHQPPQRRALQLRESKAARRLFRSVNNMIGRLDGVVGRLEAKQKLLKGGQEVPAVSAEQIVPIEELIASIRRLQSVDDPAKLQQIVQVLSRIDQDQDGAVKVDYVLKVVELMRQDEINISLKQMSEILDLVNKEESLEIEGKIVKALSHAKAIPELMQSSEGSNNDSAPTADIERVAPSPVTESNKTASSTSATSLETPSAGAGDASDATPTGASCSATVVVDDEELLREKVYIRKDQLVSENVVDASEHLLGEQVSDLNKEILKSDYDDKPIVSSKVEDVPDSERVLAAELENRAKLKMSGSHLGSR